MDLKVLRKGLCSKFSPETDREGESEREERERERGKERQRLERISISETHEPPWRLRYTPINQSINQSGTDSEIFRDRR